MNAVYIYYTPDWQPLADIVLPKVEAYCAKYGYDYWMFRKGHELNSVGFCKMETLLEIIYRFDLIWVLDLDTLITMPAPPEHHVISKL